MKKIKMAASFLAVGALLAGCGTDRGSQERSEGQVNEDGDCTRPIVIGYTAPISGPLAGIGELGKHGFETGIDKIKQDGLLGCEVETLMVDDQGDPGKSLSAAKRLVQQDKIDVYISATISSAALATSEYLNQNKIVSMLAFPSADDLFDPETYPYNFGTGPQSGAYGEALGKAILDHGHSRVAILTENLAAGQATSSAVAEKLMAGGVEPLATIEFPFDGANLDSYANRVKDLKPEAVLLCTQAPQLARLLQSFKKLGISPRLYGCAGMATPQFRDLIPDAPEGTVTAFFSPPYWRTDVPNVEAFTKLYEQRWGEQPTSSSEGQVYNALNIWAEAVRKAGTTEADAVVEELTSIEGFSGADAPMTYGEKRSPYTAGSFVPVYLVKTRPELKCTTPLNNLVFCDEETLKNAGVPITGS